MKDSKKCTPLKMFSKTLDREVTVCEEYTTQSSTGQVAAPARRRRGRPKGTTVKNGAKSPAVQACSYDSIKWVKTKKGMRCRCNMPGKNSRYLKNEKCSHLAK